MPVDVQEPVCADRVVLAGDFASVCEDTQVAGGECWPDDACLARGDPHRGANRVGAHVLAVRFSHRVEVRVVGFARVAFASRGDACAGGLCAYGAAAWAFCEPVGAVTCEGCDPAPQCGDVVAETVPVWVLVVSVWGVLGEPVEHGQVTLGTLLCVECASHVHSPVPHLRDSSQRGVHTGYS